MTRDVAVARIGGSKAWLLEDLDEYGPESPAPKRREGEMQDELMESRELAQILGIQLNSLHARINQERWSSVPEPGAKVSQTHVWRRADVDSWLRQRERERSRRDKARAKSR